MSDLAAMNLFFKKRNNEVRKQVEQIVWKQFTTG